MAKIDDYRVYYASGRAQPGGQYVYHGRVLQRTEYKEQLLTPIGALEKSDWKRHLLQAIDEAGERQLLEQIINYCREHCAWLRTEEGLEEYALECHAGRVYKHWPDFERKGGTK